ncbi:MAG: O-antigen ligase family protein, partial [Parcubacteria group bacterium]|nr:O-antigen ligase family protein [Parcubacteria group bacterium]
RGVIRYSRLHPLVGTLSIGIFAAVFIGVIPDGISGVEWYHFVRFLAIYCLFFFLIAGALLPSQRAITYTLVAAALFQSMLGIGQFIMQHDLGLRHIEAGPLDTSIDGVAEFWSGGTLFVRAYGTFPHPNMLALFLLLVIFLWIWRGDRTERPPDAHESMTWRTLLFSIATTFALVLGFFAAFSRWHLILLGCAIFFSLYIVSVRSDATPGVTRRFTLVILCGIILLAVFSNEWESRFFGMSDTSILERERERAPTLRMITEHPVFGVGIGNYTAFLAQYRSIDEAWMLQPPHNLYLLVASEIGIVGALMLLTVWCCVGSAGVRASPQSRERILKLGVLLLLAGAGFGDHAFWTLQQGQLLFWISLGLIGRQSVSV